MKQFSNDLELQFLRSYLKKQTGEINTFLKVLKQHFTVTIIFIDQIMIRGEYLNNFPICIRRAIRYHLISFHQISYFECKITQQQVLVWSFLRWIFSNFDLKEKFTKIVISQKKLIFNYFLFFVKMEPIQHFRIGNMSTCWVINGFFDITYIRHKILNKCLLFLNNTLTRVGSITLKK